MWVNLKIRGDSYIIGVASPDIEEIPDRKTNQNAYFKYCSEIANELVNKQLAYDYPMDGASDYRKSDAEIESIGLILSL